MKVVWAGSEVEKGRESEIFRFCAILFVLSHETLVEGTKDVGFPVMFIVRIVFGS